MTFLIDSGSTHSFLNEDLAHLVPTCQLAPRASAVKVAGGGILRSSEIVPDCPWSSAGFHFQTAFKVWLTTLGPMQVDWQIKWMSFDRPGEHVFLQGKLPDTVTCQWFALFLVQPVVSTVVPEEVHKLLDRFSELFDSPTELPPRRGSDHHISLLPGATPVHSRPYRHSPEMKTEIEKHISEMLESGVILPSTSAFASPLIMVRKRDHSWRPCIDYRRLNAITTKTRYPLPVIDELLDELHGASWFSKLDLRAGYHQIRLAPGEEHKTAFHTHHGHFKFLVMAFGLTGAPATFQNAMNKTLAPVLRRSALVFFDDILVYSSSYEEHLRHLEQVLTLLAEQKWRVKASKCEFAQRQITYLGHVINSSGVSTDESKVIDVCDWPTPTNLKQLRGFLGLSGYCRKFVWNYGVLSWPLSNLLRKHVPFG